MMGAAHRTGFVKHRLGDAILECRSGRPAGFGQRSPRGVQRQVFGPAGASPKPGRGDPRPATDTTRLPDDSTASAERVERRSNPTASAERCQPPGPPAMEGSLVVETVGARWLDFGPARQPGLLASGGCLQPGEPHGRQQGATDLRLVCGENRRSREKRQGRNERRIGIPGPNVRNEAEAFPRAKAPKSACPVRWTPRRAGSVVNREWTHTQNVDGGASLRRTP